MLWEANIGSNNEVVLKSYDLDIKEDRPGNLYTVTIYWGDKIKIVSANFINPVQEYKTLYGTPQMALACLVANINQQNAKLIDQITSRKPLWQVIHDNLIVRYKFVTAQGDGYLYERTEFYTDNIVNTTTSINIMLKYDEYLCPTPKEAIANYQKRSGFDQVLKNIEKEGEQPCR